MQDSKDQGIMPLAGSSLWPSAEYAQQLARLRDSVGETVYLARLNHSDIHLSVTLENRPLILLDVIDFAAHDPARGLYPHMLILDDGRGVNLGQVLRVCRDRAFAPEAAQILFQQRALMEQLLYRPRQLSQSSITSTSRQLLAALLGKTATAPLPDDQ